MIEGFFSFGFMRAWYFDTTEYLRYGWEWEWRKALSKVIFY